MIVKANGYQNFVKQDMVNEFLKTYLSMSQFMTLDGSLEAAEGMKIKINKYSASGSAEKVTEGNGNTGEISVSFVPVEYEVETTQAKFTYTDEAAMTDKKLVDVGMDALAKSLVNDMNDKAVAEFMSSTNVFQTGDSSVEFEDFIDALTMLAPLDIKNEGIMDGNSGYFALCSPKMRGIIRKNCKDNLQYVEAYVRAGYVGNLAGVPLYTSDLIDDKHIVIADKTAVTCFNKKSAQLESDRDIDKRINMDIARYVNIVALTDENHCVLIECN